MARNWGICIGVNEYRFNYRNLKYAQKDAQELGKLLKEKANFEKIYTFTQDSPPIEDIKSEFPSSPERNNFIEWLTQRFPTNTKRKKPLSLSDNLWFSFSGHGWEYEGVHYLLFADTSSNQDYLPTTAISVEFIREHLRQYSGAGNIIMFIDACRESGRRSIGKYIDKQQGVITIASCQPGGLSYEIEELEHGSFTYALLESLTLLGEGNCATIERLCKRLRTRVRELNLKYQKQLQTPYTVIEPESKYHLILLPDYITPNLNDIACLETEAFKAEAKGDYQTAEIMWQNLVRFNQDEALEALKRIWSRTSPPSISQEEAQTEERVTGSKSKSNLVLDSASIKLIEKTLGKDVTLPVFDFKTIIVNRRGQEIRQEDHSAQYFTEDLGNNITLDMVHISGGKFLMGTEDQEIERLCKKYDNDWFKKEAPQHEVTVEPFFMGKYPITQAQWQVIASLPTIKRELQTNPSYFKGDNFPVESIRWYDAVEFCARLSKLTGKQYVLPSEAQWEYACRARTTTPFYFGETITTDLANYCPQDHPIHNNWKGIYADELQGEYRQETTPVGQFHSNAFGLYDMHGNVWEWCADPWHDDYNNAPNDGSVWDEKVNDGCYQNYRGNIDILLEKSSSIVVRGGSWYDLPYNYRCAFRDPYTRAINISYVGFRLVCGFGRTS